MSGNTGPDKPPPAVKLSAAERQIKAVELRRARVTYAAIAERLGYANASGAHKAVHAALNRARGGAVDELRAEEGDMLDRLHVAYWPSALSGDLNAAKLILDLSARRSRLYGLDAALRVKHELTDETRLRVLELVDRVRELPPAPAARTA